MMQQELAGSAATLRPAPVTGRAAIGDDRPELTSGDAGKPWLRSAMSALGVLAAAAATVSWQAQYVMVSQVKQSVVIAVIEAGIPDAGALIFATLGIALALHGRRAIRARSLNLLCVGLSLAMNAMAARHGWRDVAIWVMPAAVYALASDTLIGVVRAWALARMAAGRQAFGADDATPLAALGGLLLWLLRLGLAPKSTAAGFRRWVIDECPVAPGRRAVPAATVVALAPVTAPRRLANGAASKQDLLIALASQRYDLTRIPLAQVARVARDVADEVGLHHGTARRVLRAHVLRLQDQHAARAGKEAPS